MAIAEKISIIQFCLDKWNMPSALDLKKTNPQVIRKTKKVRIAVARSESIDFSPSFPNMAVRAANNADSNAYMIHVCIFNLFILKERVSHSS